MKNKIKTAFFGAGCFWNVQYKFNQLRGVIETEAGYIGGKIKNPTYELVCTGKTGFVEVVKIKYDSTRLSYKKLLEYFFKIHDPNQYKRQGFDVGEQYSSVIFYCSKYQKNLASTYIKELTNNKIYYDTIKTLIKKATQFYPAEEYHQNYILKMNNLYK